MQLSEVSSNYDRAARIYDRLNELVFERVLRLGGDRERMIELLGDIEGATVMDVGCGTGRNFPLLAPRVGERGRIIGFDYSKGMLEKARARIHREGWSNIELVRGDAAVLHGVPEPVDAVVSAWCFGIVYDLDAALNRAVDVLRPGGRLAIMDFCRAHPDHGPLRWLYPAYGFVLKRSGIDTAEDLDDASLQAKWARGRRLLEERLEDLRVEHYLAGTGIILAGRKPAAAGAEAGQ